MSSLAARPAQTRAGHLSIFGTLSLIALGAIALRIGWRLWHGHGEISWDGAEYARLATSIAAGHYTGLRGTTMFVFPPLYSIAMLVLLPFSGNVAQAGIDVSMLSGAALVFPMYGIAAIVYGRRAGYAAASIAATLPFAVQLSTGILADMLFLSLAAAGLYFLLRTANERRIVDGVACGVAFALAYLTRPEGILLWVLALAVVFAPLLTKARSLRTTGALLLAVGVPFVALASPYVAFLSSSAHHLRIEGKSVLNLDIGLRMAGGMSYTVAADAIDRNLNQTGPELRQDYYFEPQGRTAPSLSTIAVFGLQNLVRHGREIARVLISPLCGAGVLTLLALIGFVAGPWPARRVWNQSILLGYGFVILISLASVFHFWERYFVGFVPLLIVWAAAGTRVVGDWAERRSKLRWIALVPAGLCTLLLIGLLFTSKTRFIDDSRSLAERDAGRWLAQHAHAGARILSISDQAVFYAHGTWYMLPYAPDAATALRYVEKIRPDYVVLDSEYAAERPYVQNWLASGIPDARAHLVYSRSAPQDAPIEVVRWGHVGQR